MHKAAAIILAAGESTRMGHPKWQLPFDQKQCFLEALISVYREAGFRRIVVVMNPGQLHKFSFLNAARSCILIENNNPGEGRLRSVELGISAIGDCSRTFLQNIDNPFTTTDLIRQMLSLRETADYVVPVCNEKRGHPLLIGQAVINMLKTGHPDCDFRNLLIGFSYTELHYQDQHILIDINTPEIYASCFPSILK